MHPRRHLAALVLLAFALVGIEQTLCHTDDGCVIETHCSACLLQLGTAAVVAAVFSPPPVVLLGERIASAPVTTHEPEEPRHVSSRGPPLPL